MAEMINPKNCLLPVGSIYGLAWAAGEAPDSMKAAPTEPVLFFKTKNTYLPSGADVLLPASVPAVEASAVVGLVFGRDARCVAAGHALAHVSGYVLAIDISEPDAGTLRPPIREKCRDGFLPLASRIVPADGVALESIAVELRVDGQTVAEANLHGRAAAMDAVIAAASQFMTFRAGDVLLVTPRATGTYVPVGSVINAVSTTLGHVSCRTVKEDEAAR